MFTFGLISSVFDYLTFVVLFIVFKAESSLFRSSWFIFSILTEIVVLMLMRSKKMFFKSRLSPMLLYSSAMIVAITLILPYSTPINEMLNIEPIKPLVFLSIFGILVLYVIVTEIAKYYFYKSE